MKIAVVTRDFPYPHTGLNLVVQNLVAGLASEHQIRWFILRGDDPYSLSNGYQQSWNFRYDFEECPSRLTAAQGRRNLSRASRYYGVRLERLEWLEQRVAAFAPDRIVGFDYNLAPYLALLRTEAPRILDAVDSEILHYAKQLLVGNCNGSVLRHLLAAALAGMEHLSKFAAVVSVSEADSRSLRLAGARNVFTVPNGVDHEFYAPNSSHPERPDEIVFCGSLSFEPNVQAISWFLDRCWRHVLTERPQAQLVVIGKWPSPDLKSRLERYRQVRCIGYVEDVRDYIGPAAVSIAPMVSGAGIKNKILEAWAMAKPVVATRAAVKGLDCTHGENILVAASAGQFARHVARLLRDRTFARTLGAAGRVHVINRYSWERARAEFCRIVSEAAPRDQVQTATAATRSLAAPAPTAPENRKEYRTC